MTKVVLFVVLLSIARAASECVRKEDGYSSFACTCTADQCTLPGDTVPEQGENQALIYSNSRDEYRFKQESQDISAADAELEADVTITLNPSETFQKIIGFGSSFTDAAGLNIKKLSEPAQQMLMKAYFGKEGADYSVMRIPLAGSDFSTRPYSYADTPGDTELKDFALVEEDFEYKLPYIRKSIEMSDKEVFLIASPWAPPAWMKTNGMFNGTGELLKEMYQPYANYFVRFVEEYEKEIGSPLWGLTTQNEPLSGYTNWAWNTCGWTAEDTRDWIAENLGPTLEAAGMRRLKLMVDDYNRFSLPWYPAPMVLHENSSKYIDGIALHWYDDKVIGPEVLDEMHELAPEKFMLYTEACSGWSPPHDFGVHLGSWERGEDYIKNIIEDLNHWQTGWIDWNMALDMEGGPNWANNLVDSPIVVNDEADEFYLQPTYAAMSHFSRFLQRDAERIGYEVAGNEDGNIHVTAFQNPDESKVLIIANVGEEASTFGIEYPEGKLSTNLDAKSWHTIVIP